jgi:hypothetical protein
MNSEGLGGDDITVNLAAYRMSHKKFPVLIRS